MFKEREKLIPGTQVELSGETYTVPPLTLGQVKRLAPTLEKVANMKAVGDALPPDVLDAIGTVVHTALNRNYECSVEEILDIMDMASIQDVIAAIMGVSGMRKGTKPTGEA